MKWSWPNPRTTLVFSWRDWGKSQRCIVGVEVKLPEFLTSAEDEGEWLASRSGRIIPEERVLNNHWARGRVASQPVWTRWRRREIFFLPPGIEAQASSRSLPLDINLLCSSRLWSEFRKESEFHDIIIGLHNIKSRGCRSFCHTRKRCMTIWYRNRLSLIHGGRRRRTKRRTRRKIASSTVLRFPDSGPLC
jgi:hypothetical protein